MRIAAALVVGMLTLIACGSNSGYAGLSRKEAVAVAMRAVEADLDPSKRPYFEVSIWNIAAEHAADVDGRRVWLIGIWNGQADSGRCALVATRHGSTLARVVPCASYPKFAR